MKIRGKKPSKSSKVTKPKGILKEKTPGLTAEGVETAGGETTGEETQYGETNKNKIPGAKGQVNRVTFASDSKHENNVMPTPEAKETNNRRNI